MMTGPQPEMKRKTLFSDTVEGVTTQVNLRYNVNTEHITITPGYNKSRGNSGRSKTNRSCTQFLGVHVAERVLAKVFRDVKRMPLQHPFDFTCNHGKKIDVKSSVLYDGKGYAPRWLFHIERNTIPDYFLCLAFDNRESLNPQHIWLIPGDAVNDKVSISTTTSKVGKWSNYELDKLDRVIACCGRM